MTDNPYRKLAARLDELPNGFPPAADGSDLRLLAKLFTPEEADLVADLRLTLETPGQIAARTRRDSAAIAPVLKTLAQHGMVKAGRGEGGLGFAILPFIVGFFENQNPVLDVELSQLFDQYYRQAFGQVNAVAPQYHRVIPVDQTVDIDMEVRPYESAAQIVANAKAWAVTDCICRKQKALIGEACEHPIDVCMVLSPVPSAFDRWQYGKVLTQEEALATLRRAAESGLVPTVSNNRAGTSYICNCCTCGCGILRGLSELGMANVVARSAFVNRVDEDACQGCESCLPRCQFGALSMDGGGRVGVVYVDAARCVGCGACVVVCPEHALSLVRRPEDEVLPVPADEQEWQAERAEARGLDLGRVL
jgi:Na+-translocating ferredoxin:NAD+ oxidoreductase subunit B